jgi:hypothetical protein
MAGTFTVGIAAPIAAVLRPGHPAMTDLQWFAFVILPIGVTVFEDPNLRARMRATFELQNKKETAEFLEKITEFLKNVKKAVGAAPQAAVDGHLIAR